MEYLFRNSPVTRDHSMKSGKSVFTSKPHATDIFAFGFFGISGSCFRVLKDRKTTVSKRLVTLYLETTKELPP